jgi:hypothetical protein
VKEFTGTPLLAAANTAGLDELRVQRIIHGGEVQSQALRNRAAIEKAGGRAMARNATIGAGATLLAGIGRGLGNYAIATA